MALGTTLGTILKDSVEQKSLYSEKPCLLVFKNSVRFMK